MGGGLSLVYGEGDTLDILALGRCRGLWDGGRGWISGLAALGEVDTFG